MYGLAVFVAVVAVFILVFKTLTAVFPEPHDGQTCVAFVEKEYSIHGRNALVCTEWK